MNSDKWIDSVAKQMLRMDEEEAADITRFIIDAERGKGFRFRVHWNNLGREEIFDLLPVTDDRYELVEVEGD